MSTVGIPYLYTYTHKHPSTLSIYMIKDDHKYLCARKNPLLRTLAYGIITIYIHKNVYFASLADFARKGNVCTMRIKHVCILEQPGNNFRNVA